MVFMSRKKGETKDSLFRKFTRSFIEEEIIDEVKKRLYYKKPSLVRQEEEKERRRNRFHRFPKKIIRRVGFGRR